MFDSNWLEVAVILVLWVYWHRAKEDSAVDWRVAETFTKKAKPVWDGDIKTVVPMLQRSWRTRTRSLTIILGGTGQTASQPDRRCSPE